MKTIELSAQSKRANNLKLVKEQLYEMKRSIDANVNLDRLESSSSSSSIGLILPQQQKRTATIETPPPPAIVSSTTQALKQNPNQLKQPKPIVPSIRVDAVKPVGSASSTNQRTTPRKVKKRSGERSLTTGIIFDSISNQAIFDDDQPKNFNGK